MLNQRLASFLSLGQLEKLKVQTESRSLWHRRYIPICAS